MDARYPDRSRSIPSSRRGAADDRDQLVELGILVDVVAGGWQVHTLARCDVLQYEAAQWAVVEEPVQVRPKVSPSLSKAPSGEFAR